MRRLAAPAAYNARAQSVQCAAPTVVHVVVTRSTSAHVVKDVAAVARMKRNSSERAQVNAAALFGRRRFSRLHIWQQNEAAAAAVTRPPLRRTDGARFQTEADAMPRSGGGGREEIRSCSNSCDALLYARASGNRTTCNRGEGSNGYGWVIEQPRRGCQMIDGDYGNRSLTIHFKQPVVPPSENPCALQIGVQGGPTLKKFHP
jgi:hypothetical protein